VKSIFCLSFHEPQQYNRVMTELASQYSEQFVSFTAVVPVVLRKNLEVKFQPVIQGLRIIDQSMQTLGKIGNIHYERTLVTGDDRTHSAEELLTNFFTAPKVTLIEEKLIDPRDGSPQVIRFEISDEDQVNSNDNSKAIRDDVIVESVISALSHEVSTTVFRAHFLGSAKPKDASKEFIGELQNLRNTAFEITRTVAAIEDELRDKKPDNYSEAEAPIFQLAGLND